VGCVPEWNTVRCQNFDTWRVFLARPRKKSGRDDARDEDGRRARVGEALAG